MAGCGCTNKSRRRPTRGKPQKAKPEPKGRPRKAKPEPKEIDEKDEVHKVYLSINIIRGEIKHGRNVAKSTVSCRDVTEGMVGIINDIFSPSGIKFVVKNCKSHAQDVVRSSVYTDDVRDVEQLFDKKRLFIKDAVNIFLVPIVGDETNGYQFGTRESFIVQGINNPIEWKPYNKIELAKLLAHEIGHDLGLKQHTGDEGNLMYSYGPGPTGLDKAQIKKMRKYVPSRFLARSRPERCCDVISLLEEPVKYKARK